MQSSSSDSQQQQQQSEQQKQAQQLDSVTDRFNDNDDDVVDANKAVQAMNAVCTTQTVATKQILAADIAYITEALEVTEDEAVRTLRSLDDNVAPDRLVAEALRTLIVTPSK